MFPERGFPGDRLFPDFVPEAGEENEELENVGCAELSVVSVNETEVSCCNKIDSGFMPNSSMLHFNPIVK